MKVIFITRESQDMPAVRVRCYGFAKYLSRAGIDTEVFSYADILGAKSGKDEGKITYRDIFEYNLKAFKSLYSQDAVLFLQRCHYHSFAPFLLKVIKKQKLILDLDDWEARENTVYYFGRIPNSKAEIAIGYLAGKSDLCVGASRFLCDFLSRHNKNVIYIPTGVDTEVFCPDNIVVDSGPVVISWMGTVYRRDNVENIEFLLECFKQLGKEGENAVLEIAGDGIYWDQVVKLAGAYNDPRVRLKSWISPLKIPEYLKNISIGIMPLIQDTKFNKAKSPTRLFEYMAMEKPVIASKIGEASHIIQDGENGFLAVTKDDFVGKLKELIRDVKLREHFGKKAKETILREYSLEQLSRRMLERLSVFNKS